jgi:hypothetical protein
MSTSRVPTPGRASTERRYLTGAAVLVLSALVLFVATPARHPSDAGPVAGGMAVSVARGVILGPPVTDTVPVPVAVTDTAAVTDQSDSKPDTGPGVKPHAGAPTSPPAPERLPQECMTLAAMPAYTTQGAEVFVPDGAVRVAEILADGVSGQLPQAACAAEVADQHGHTTPPPPASPPCPEGAPIWTGVTCVPDHHGPCPPWQAPDESGACVVPDCPTGHTVAEDGTCVPNSFPPCPAGTVRAEDGTCVPNSFYDCPAGTLRAEDGTCVPAEYWGTPPGPRVPVIISAAWGQA